MATDALVEDQSFDFVLAYSEPSCNSSMALSSADTLSALSDGVQRVESSGRQNAPDVLLPKEHIVGAVPCIQEHMATGKEKHSEENRRAVDALPSVGSLGHEDGTCNPCVFWLKADCMLGKKCRNCHYQHEWSKEKMRKRFRRKRIDRAASHVASAHCSTSASSKANPSVARISVPIFSTNSDKQKGQSPGKRVSHDELLLKEDLGAAPCIQEHMATGIDKHSAENRRAVGDFPDVGRVAHEKGTCRPCIFWIKAVCVEGKDCPLCHYTHEWAPKKGMMRFRKKAPAQAASSRSNPKNPAQAASSSSIAKDITQAASTTASASKVSHKLSL